jgi:hypothetical protein
MLSYPNQGITQTFAIGLRKPMKKLSLHSWYGGWALSQVSPKSNFRVLPLNHPVV